MKQRFNTFPVCYFKEHWGRWVRVVVCFCLRKDLAYLLFEYMFSARKDQVMALKVVFPNLSHTEVSCVCSQCATAFAPRKKKVLPVKMIRWKGSAMALLLLRLLK